MKYAVILIPLATLAVLACNPEVGKVKVSKEEIAVSPASSTSNTVTRGYVETDKFTETYQAQLHPAAGAAEQHPRTMSLSAFLYPQDGTEENYFVGQDFAQSSGDEDIWWSVDKKGNHDPIYWPIGGSLDFLAYSVSSEISGPGAAKKVVASWNDQNAAKSVKLFVPAENTQNDILFSSLTQQEVFVGSDVMNMTFKHAQAWLEFVLIAGEGTVDFEKIELEDIYCGGTLNIYNNSGNAYAEWDFSGEKSRNTPVDNYFGVKTLTSTPQFLDMLIPQQQKTAIVVYYSVGGIKKSYRIETDMKTWLMGEKYIYKIRIDGSVETAVSVSLNVAKWQSVDAEEIEFL